METNLSKQIIMGAVIAANLLCSATYGMKSQIKEEILDDKDENYTSMSQNNDKKPNTSEASKNDAKVSHSFEGVCFYMTNCRDKDIKNLLVSGAYTEKLPKVKRIQLTSCTLKDKETIHEFAKYCKNLMTVIINSCSTTLQVIKTIVDLYPNLDTFFIRDMNITDKVAIIIANGCKNLKNFVAFKTALTDKGITEIANSCKELERIDLGYSHMTVTDKSLIALSERMSLKTVMASFCYGIEGEGVSALVKNCPNISMLSFGDIDLSEQAVIDIGTYGKNVKHLDLDDCDGVTNKSLLALAGCGSLNDLDLKECCPVSNEGIIEVIKNCPITRLTLDDCNKVDNTVIAALAGKNQIEYLSIERCKKVTKEAVKMLVKCTKLKHIRVRCSGIDDKESIKRLKEAGIEIKE